MSRPTHTCCACRHRQKVGGAEEKGEKTNKINKKKKKENENCAVPGHGVLIEAKVAREIDISFVT